MYVILCMVINKCVCECICTCKCVQDRVGKGRPTKRGSISLIDCVCELGECMSL